MREQGKVIIRKISSGVPGLDEVLGGGIPEYSFNVIAGPPGSGKTTLAHQIMFANATREHPALYFTTMGEPAIKMLRFQQQFSFFDPARLASDIRYISLSSTAFVKDPDAVLDEMSKAAETAGPGIVIIDSFHTLALNAQTPRESEFRAFIQRLSLLLIGLQATSFLISQTGEQEMGDNPISTIADSIIFLSQKVERNSVERKVRVIKLRGQDFIHGLHTIRITDDGLKIFPRSSAPARKRERIASRGRVSSGIAELDKMLGGGIPSGDSVLVSGPSGAGKSVLASQFIAEGIRRGEPGVIAVFEERPQEYAERAKIFGIDLETPEREGKLHILSQRPLDLSLDEAMYGILDSVRKIGAKRLVLDSLTGFEMALAPGFRSDFRESLYRLISGLTASGVTIMSTTEMEESFTEFLFSAYMISFLTDDIIRLRYVEIDGQLRKILTIIKMRGGAHSTDIREYRITAKGLVIDDRPLTGYRGLITGLPEPGMPVTEKRPKGTQALIRRKPDE